MVLWRVLIVLAVAGCGGSAVATPSVVPASPAPPSPARRLQITLLDIDGGVLAILVGGSIAEWDRALEMATPVVESVTIGR